MSQTDPPSGVTHLFAELRRRHVVRFVIGYAAAAFVVLQLAEIVFPAFGIGEDGLRVLVVLTALGFVPALVLAWVYDITTEGIKRTDEERPVEGVPSRMALVALAGTTVVVTGALGLYLVDQDVLGPSGTPLTAAGTPALAAAYDPAEPIRSLAVLPLDDFSPTADQAYFTSAMHEELIAKLSQVEGLRVVSRTTVMRYANPETRPASPEIGRELGVEALIEGSVTRGSSLVRVTLQIIHAPSDSHIRTLQWERTDLGDVLSFQTEIAHAVVDSLRGEHDHSGFELVTAASTDPEAQEAYLRARHEYDRGTADGYRMALEYFQEALAEDPEFAAALAGAAGARFLVGLEDPQASEQDLARARLEAHRALELDSASVEAKEVVSLIERGMPRVMGEIVLEEPLAGSATSVVTSPGTFDPVDLAFDSAWITAITGLGERIEEQMRRRGFAAPRAEGAEREALEARRLMSAGRYPDATRVLERVVVQTPDATPAWEMLARSRAAVGDVRGATDVVARWGASGAPGAPDGAWVQRLQESVRQQGSDGYWSWTLERLARREADGAIVPRIDLAGAHAALGHDEEALDLLAEALERGEPGVLTIRSDPVWDDLRTDRRFRQIARQAQALRFSPAVRPPRPPRSGR